MLDTQYNREINKRMDKIARDAIIEEKKQNINERPRGMHSVTANGPAQAFSNIRAMKPMKGRGNEYEEKEDTRRVQIENAMGAGKPIIETKYKKQMPILGGGNMEMVPPTDEREKLIKGGGAIPVNTFSRLIISELKNQKGAGWADAIKEIPKSSASAPEAPISGAGMSKRTARADKIKEIMKTKGMKMTEASSYIKKNNIPY